MLNKKYREAAVFFLVIIFFYNNIISQQEKVELNNWITDWNLLGPIELVESTNEVEHLGGFENDIFIDNGGIADPEIKVGQVVTYENKNATWIKYSSPDSIINLDEAISKRSYVAAYGYKEIYSEEVGIFVIALGTNDGGRLWVNGVEVWDYPGARGLKPDDNYIPVFFQKGNNKILLKVEERGNSWGFCLRILPFKIDAFMERGKLFDIVTFPEGRPELRFSLSDSVVDNLFESIDLEIYSNEISPKLIWRNEWNKKKRMELNIKDREYKPYLLKISAERKDGKKWYDQILFNSGKRIDHTLFSNKKTDYKIVVGSEASESEKWAAKELQNTLLKISGASFEISGDESDLTTNEIVVGYNKHSKQLLGEQYVKPEQDDESFTYHNINSNIVLIGGSQRGTMYSVFSLLENEFGVRWYTPDVTAIPSREKYIFNYLDHHEAPSIKVRNDFYYEAFDPTWAAHNRINGAMGYRAQYGGIEGYWSVHTFYKFMPPNEFFEDHPEYYSLIDGKRIHDHAQLCLTNPDVLEIITERLKKVMRENPSNLIYSVSQNDWRNPCECDNCQEIVVREGTQSGIMVWFVNQVAERIKDEFPNKYVGTLAYQYTRKPPKIIKPNENVVIRLCSIECCFAHDFSSCPENQEFLTDLQEWSAISPHLYIWDYVVNFSHYIMPYPNFNVLQSNINTFKENSSIGIMEQAAYQSRGGEFSELRAYLIAKLLWNSECEVNEVIDDFMYGYYGRSGQYVRMYFDLLHSLVKPNTHIHLGLRPDDIIFTETFISEADKIFDEAEKAANNDEVIMRVEMARLPLMYLKCLRDPLNSQYDGTYERFSKIVEREGITHFAEMGIPHVEDFHNRINNAK